MSDHVWGRVSELYIAARSQVWTANFEAAVGIVFIQGAVVHTCALYDVVSERACFRIHMRVNDGESNGVEGRANGG